MRRGLRRGRVRSKAKGYDWIVTEGEQTIILLDPISGPTLAEFPLITTGEVRELGEPILVERVVGECWLTAPFRSGETNGAARISWGIRVVDTDATVGGGAYLPSDPGDPFGMETGWMFLRSHILGNIGVPQFQALPLNLFPQVATGGRHATQGGPCVDINTKRKMRDTQVLTLSVSVNALLDWVVNGTVDQYNTGDNVSVYLHLRTLVRATGR